MTTVSPTPARTSTEALRAEFAPLFSRIRAGAVERERTRDLPFLVVEELKVSGFTALRVPPEFGGRGVGLSDFAALLVDLAAADSNVAHLFRGHIAFLERLLLRPPGDHRDQWLRRIGAGALIGNAASERQELSEITTRLEQRGGQWTVTGTKYYTTGSIYADWISLSAVHGDTRHSVLVDASHHGVRVADDWDGFGQQLTASGGLTLSEVPVDPRDVRAFDADDPHSGFVVGLFQMILLLVAAGVAQAAVEDAVDYVRPRRRTFAHRGELAPRDQDVVQTVVGEVAAKAHAARLIVLSQSAALDAYARKAADGTLEGASTDLLTKESQRLARDVFQAQLVVLELVQRVTTEIFEVGGASATSTVRGLDRHWRNARTIASHNPAKYRARAVGEYLLTGEFALWGGQGPATGRDGQAEQEDADHD
ncbi:acyl-CoA dehydrogenase family protein [Citricoccus sp.]|uniref:acyl-CoA dehydrogenase family protein n=1 Tax=Citricoccus sp. TaxID=1978372 RepID=UPI0028BEA274|nr:acyl-CoA dehydrogenase family protein [Citricoccus sp.]